LNKEYIKIAYETGSNDDAKKVEFQIKEMIPLSSALAVTSEVVELLFTGDEYTPALYDYVYWKTLLSYYTDINTNIDPDDLIDLLYNSTLVSAFYQNVSMQQIGAIENAIQEAVDARKSKSELDLLMRDIRYMIKRYEKVLDKSITPRAIKSLFSVITDKVKDFDMSGFLPQQNVKDDLKM